jgi:hypothetical protein
LRVMTEMRVLKGKKKPQWQVTSARFGRSRFESQLGIYQPIS